MSTIASPQLRSCETSSAVIKAEAGADYALRLYSLPELWHLLSLDAPTVATLWAWLAVRCAGLHRPQHYGESLFLGVWLLYVADRLLDSRPTAVGSKSALLEERHRFHWYHRQVFLALLLGGSLLLVSLLREMDSHLLRLCLLLSVALLLWLLRVHAPRDASGRPPPKELAVGPFFAAAAFLPALVHEPVLTAARTLPFALAFTAACTLNCLLLYAWEHPGDATNAHAATGWCLRQLPWLCLAAAGGCLCLGLAATVEGASGTGSAGLAPLGYASALSILLLLLLDQRRSRIAPLTLRVAGDAALLTPLLFLPFLH